MILEFEKLVRDVETVSGDERVAFRDVSGEDNHIDCHVDLNIRKVAETFYIHADVHGTFSTPCHKCLETTRVRVNPSFDLVVQRGGERWDEDEIPEEDEYIYVSSSEREISLDQSIYEHLVVEIPIQITCRDRCQGLCPACGVNLNHQTCSCSPEPDPRWDALNRIRDKLPGSGQR